MPKSGAPQCQIDAILEFETGEKEREKQILLS